MFARVRHSLVSISRPSTRRSTTIVRPLVHILLGITLLFGLLALPAAQPVAASTEAQVYWGAMMKGSTYGYSDAPWDDRTINTFQANAGKNASIIHWGQPWFWSTRGGYQPFQKSEVEKVRLLGSIPMINWNAWDLASSSKADQPTFKLSTIINGNHDAYLRQWARDARIWGYPLFVRMNHEMNGNWYPWSERRNGNSTGEYVKAWRHVIDIFRAEGANNVTWVWCVNTVYAEAIPLSGLYPGDSYVDWVSVDSYNWGTNPAKPNQEWLAFNKLFKPTYDQLQALAPTKPIVIAEVGSTEYGGSKAAWITDMLQTQLPINFPNVKAVVWFNWNIFEHSGTMDWAIESSSTATRAFAAGIGSSYYATNTFSNLPKLSKVQPLGSSQGALPADEAEAVAPVVTPSPTATQEPAPTPSPTVTVPTSVNLLQNASFETSVSSTWYAPWTSRNDLGATFTKDASTKAAGSHSMKVSMTKSNATQPWVVQLRHHGLTITAGKSYTISFATKASNARLMDVLLQKSGVKEYSKQQPKLTTTWTRYTYTFVAPTTATDLTLAFNLATTSGQVWLDDVALLAH